MHPGSVVRTRWRRHRLHDGLCANPRRICTYHVKRDARAGRAGDSDTVAVATCDCRHDGSRRTRHATILPTHTKSSQCCTPVPTSLPCMCQFAIEILMVITPANSNWTPSPLGFPSNYQPSHWCLHCAVPQIIPCAYYILNPPTSPGPLSSAFTEHARVVRSSPPRLHALLAAECPLDIASSKSLCAPGEHRPRA